MVSAVDGEYQELEPHPQDAFELSSSRTHHRSCFRYVMERATANFRKLSLTAYLPEDIFERLDREHHRHISSKKGHLVFSSIVIRLTAASRSLLRAFAWD